MRIPIDGEYLQCFVTESQLFEKTNERMLICLRKWYEDEPAQFLEEMHADYTRVLEDYNFKNQGVSISRSYNYEPPLDYISCTIAIIDAQGDCCMKYTAYYNYDLYCFDDKLAG